MDKFRLEAEEVFHMSFPITLVWKRNGKETEQFLRWSLIGIGKILSDSERLDMM